MMKLARSCKNENCGNRVSAHTAWRNYFPVSVTSCARRTTRALRRCVSTECEGRRSVPKKTRGNQRRRCGPIRAGVTRHPGAAKKGRRKRVQGQALGKARVHLGTGGGLTRGFYQGVRIVEGTAGKQLRNVVKHIACARVDVFDHYEITVSRPVREHYGGKGVMGAGT
jgi:hypothetical protein